MVPIETFVTDPDLYVNAIKRMKTLFTNEKFIIPGHDNGVFSRFNKINDRVVKLIDSMQKTS